MVMGEIELAARSARSDGMSRERMPGERQKEKLSPQHYRPRPPPSYPHRPSNEEGKGGEAHLHERQGGAS